MRAFQSKLDSIPSPTVLFYRAAAARIACVALLIAALAGGAACKASTKATHEASKASELRDLGLAQLENENPDQAEATYRRLVELRPKEPLGHANLAIALLRQQKHDGALAAIDTALKLAPGRADLLAIRGETLQWQGELEAALKDLDAAARKDPDDPEILYSAYQLASTLDGVAADAVADRTLTRLAELRPENVVVLLQKGQRAIAAGDRADATGVFLRIGELLWQSPPLAERALDMVTTSFESDDLSAARVPALRLENVLKVSPMFRESLRELKTGIQGIPVARFLDEPAPTDFGPPGSVTFAGRRLAETPTSGRGLAVATFSPPTADGDGAEGGEIDPRPAIARLRLDGRLEILELQDAGKGWQVSQELDASSVDGKAAEQLLAVDVDNDGGLDLVACGPGHCVAYRGTADGFVAAPDHFGLSAAGAAALETLDFDIEGDLDLVTGGAEGSAGGLPVDLSLDLWRNSLSGPLEQVGDRSFPASTTGLQKVRGVFASDLDRDGDLDLAVAHGGGVSFLANLRQGQFEDRTESAGLGGAPAAADVVAADLDGDGRPELVTALLGLRVWTNRGEKEATRFEPARAEGLPATGVYHRVIAFDADNDGRLDLAAAGPAGLGVWQQQADGGFRALALEDGPKAASLAKASALEAADLDSDGDLDLLVGSDEGLHWLENRGGSKNGWLSVRLRGLDKGSSKNNFYGVGSLVEVRNGTAYQFREARGDVVHFGLGNADEAEVLRVVWTNGVPQNRLDVGKSRRVVEEQLLKGSCPFLYAWDGEGFRFVTDLLWGSPLGLPAAEGAWVPADPSELVRVDGLTDDDGVYRLRVTEELWEAAFFDTARLWVVDHPADMEVASALRIIPGGAGPGENATPEEVRALRALRPVAEAHDGRGRDVTARVAARDEVYADGYRDSPYQGVAPRWTFTFDLGEAPNGPVRLALDGWIFPADASLNLAVSQRADYPYLPPRLEVETDEGWQELMPSFGPDAFGHPAGKTKTTVVDTPALPEGAHRLRLVTSLWLHWDRIAWAPLDQSLAADGEPTVVAKLEPARANLRYRGFSQLVRQAPNAPHTFDYARVRLDSPWIDFPGGYTRYGDVGKLLEEVDDFTVVLAPGDEMVLDFDGSSLAPPAEGMTRTFFLESWGWDKDADRNTWQAPQVGPLPFHAMGSYPYPDGVDYPDTPEHRRYVEEWQTRERGETERQ